MPKTKYRKTKRARPTGV